MQHPVAFQQLPASPVLDSWLPRNYPEQNGHSSDITEGESLIPRTCTHRDYFYSIRISVQGIKLTSPIDRFIHKWEMSTAA